MPMYYPDLESVRRCCEAMARNKGDKKYNGIIPKTEDELPRARILLARYFREVWRDRVAGMEVELAVTQDNYEEKMKEGVMKELGMG